MTKNWFSWKSFLKNDFCLLDHSSLFLDVLPSMRYRHVWTSSIPCAVDCASNWMENLFLSPFSHSSHSPGHFGQKQANSETLTALFCHPSLPWDIWPPIYSVQESLCESLSKFVAQKFGQYFSNFAWNSGLYIVQREWVEKQAEGISGKHLCLPRNYFYPALSQGRPCDMWPDGNYSPTPHPTPRNFL